MALDQGYTAIQVARPMCHILRASGREERTPSANAVTELLSTIQQQNEQLLHKLQSTQEETDEQQKKKVVPKRVEVGNFLKFLC